MAAPSEECGASRSAGYAPRMIFAHQAPIRSLDRKVRAQGMAICSGSDCVAEEARRL
jgi:hypothetical protein